MNTEVEKLIRQKMQILRTANTISDSSYKVAMDFLDGVAALVPEEKSNSIDAMMTHLAMFVERAKKEEQVDEVSPEVARQIKSEPNLKLAEQFLDEHLYKKMKSSANESENALLLMHTLNIFFS